MYFHIHMIDICTSFYLGQGRYHAHSETWCTNSYDLRDRIIRVAVTVNFSIWLFPLQIVYLVV